MLRHMKESALEFLRNGFTQVDTAAEDAKIEADIKMKLGEDISLHGTHIHVESRQGNVTLSGTVFTQDQISKAREVAYSAQNVRGVISNLRVK